MEAGQSDRLALKISRWFEAVASGNENINDRQSAYRHLELLYDEVRLSFRDEELNDFHGRNDG